MECLAPNPRAVPPPSAWHHLFSAWHWVRGRWPAVTRVGLSATPNATPPHTRPLFPLLFLSLLLLGHIS